jgi:hypothetical protein
VFSDRCVGDRETRVTRFRGDRLLRSFKCPGNRTKASFRIRQSELAQDSLLLYYNAWPGSGALPIQVVMILGEHRETDIFATTGNYKKINHDGGDL